MKIIPLQSIEVKNRQRTAIATGPLNELKESILGRGLLNPPVCWFNVEEGSWILVAGERRLRAVQEISKERKEFFCGDSPVPVGSIAVTPLGDYLSAIGRFEAELDENVQRVDLEWPDKMKAYAALHEMRKLQNPSQTVTQTAQELSAKTNQAEARSHRLITQASVIAKHLDNPKIAMARNASEALTLIYKQEEEKVMAALVKRQIASMPIKPEIEIQHADLFKVLPQLWIGTYDLILADPPYGIAASGAGFRARSVHHHNYTDTAQSAKDIAQTILSEGFRLCKPRANIFIFCDIDLFPWLKTTASNLGWEPFRRPLIWMKSESEGLAPWGAQGPRITTEFIFYATKGQRGLNASPIDVFDDRRVSRSERIHAAEKPVSLFERLINCSCLPGDVVLDPCCGSGASLVACKALQRRALGIEIDEDYYNAALTNVFGGKS
jgi:site-specific DNA-methyltransferase (adenine-specific)